MWLAAAAANATAGECVADWGKCGGKGYDGPTACCNTLQECVRSDEYYSECVPRALQPFPKAPPTPFCGDGTRANPAAFGREVSPREIATVWKAATAGLRGAHAEGGAGTCVAAVTVALGECGHPAQSAWRSIDDKVCTVDASGAGGLWQVTSQDGDDAHLAGCTDGFDYCCNARIAYAHAMLQGGATVVPADYCELRPGDGCGQLRVPVSGAAWNDPAVDRSKAGRPIPDCTPRRNPWYGRSGFALPGQAADQEPCWFGPFSVAGGGVGRPFFPGFYGWGGFLQHYTDSKAGECDVSPQGNAASCDQPLPTYFELAEKACAADGPTPPPPGPPPGPPPPPPGGKCHSIDPKVDDAWCQANCNNQPPFCPKDLCECSA